MSDVVVLCYHAVSDDWPAQIAVTGERFSDQLRTLVERGYVGATFTEAVLSPPQARTLAVTFDDALRSVLERAFPVLEEIGLPGTVFVPTEFVGLGRPVGWAGTDRWLDGPHAEELVPMTWDELRLLEAAGWEIASHTHTHPRLVTIGDEELREELAGSKARIEEALGKPCRSLAYPFGEVDERVVEAARGAGYAAAGGLAESRAPVSDLNWPRTGVWRSDGPVSFRIEVSPPVRALRRSPAWRWLDGPRRGLKRVLRPARGRHPWRKV
jgi:peptidoglycan/xylan/chitin deacetylase (PgdA/CDA1 family)